MRKGVFGRSLVREYARQYLRWQYEPPYDLYTIAPEFWERELAEMFRLKTDDAYYAVLESGELAGYFELHHRGMPWRLE